MRSLPLLLLPLLFAPGHADAAERVYGAEPMASQWQVSAEAQQCRLTQPIPRFGEAVFVQPLDAPLRLEIRSIRPQQPGTVAIRAIPPEWRPGHPIVEYGDLALKAGERRLRLADKRAEWLLAELEEGVYPALFFPEPKGRDGVSVVLSGVRFRDALEEFLACRAGLLKVDVAALRTRTVYFAESKAELGPKAREALKETATFAAAGAPGRQVLVEGYADATGSAGYNARLAERRARAVRDFLVAQGVGREQIRVSAYGESSPAANNRNEAGRARNRRARIRVVN